MHVQTEPTKPNPSQIGFESHEIKTLILKLRWIGAHDEAERLSRLLAVTAPSETTLIGPLDTD